MGLWLSFPGFQVVGKAQRIVSSTKKVKGEGVGIEAEVTLLSSFPPPPPAFFFAMAFKHAYKLKI